MAEQEQEKGFTVKDRRLFDERGERREEGEAPAAKPAPAAQPAPAADRAADPQPAPAAGGSRLADPAPQECAPHNRSLPPVDFSSFILSLSHTALFHLGQIPDPQTGQTCLDLELARHTIDTLGMLREKTQGNLDGDEQKFLDGVLTELRLAYVQLAR